MAIAAFKTSAFRNAVSRLHRRVSQQMWEGLWPKLPVWEVPITSITNGVHLPTWINGDLAGLYDQYLQPDWREGHAEAEGVGADRRDSGRGVVGSAPAAQAADWSRSCASARRRARCGRNAPASEVKRLQEVLDPEALTIGFRAAVCDL